MCYFCNILSHTSSYSLFIVFPLFSSSMAVITNTAAGGRHRTAKCPAWNSSVTVHESKSCLKCICVCVCVCDGTSHSSTGNNPVKSSRETGSESSSSSLMKTLNDAQTCSESGSRWCSGTKLFTRRRNINLLILQPPDYNLRWWSDQVAAHENILIHSVRSKHTWCRHLLRVIWSGGRL